MNTSPGSNAAFSQQVSREGPQPDSDHWNYEATVVQVETILARIESGELELAEVFEQFSAAVNYLRQCEAFLAQRQKQVDLLIETLTEEEF